MYVYLSFVTIISPRLHIVLHSPKSQEEVICFVYNIIIILCRLASLHTVVASF